MHTPQYDTFRESEYVTAPHLLIFLKDETPESLRFDGVGSTLTNGKKRGTVYPKGSHLLTAGARGKTGTAGAGGAAGTGSSTDASSRNSNKSSPPVKNTHVFFHIATDLR